MIVRNVMGHAGVELMPRALADSRWFGWINATTHHDLHHQSFHYNYGLYFTWWDRLMGTEHPAYRTQLRGDREAAAGKSGVRRPLVATGGTAMPSLSSGE
jgi:sterol desaturase/sphingolipid hydroxylase (fatty acid hydroxylase superfamily)